MSNNLGDYLRELRGSESLRSVANRTEGELSHSYISDLEKGVSRRGNIIKPSPHALKVLATVYNADYNHLMNLAGYAEANKDKNYYDLNKKDEQDIASDLEEMIKNLSGGGLLFSKDTSEVDKETRELLIASLENSLRIAKMEAKRKFTPKKYRD